MAEILPEDSGTIRCICCHNHDDNFTIQCERCNAWQHATCVNIRDENSVPEHYMCPECSGTLASVDANKAREHQREVLRQRTEYQRLLSENALALKGVKSEAKNELREVEERERDRPRRGSRRRYQESDRTTTENCVGTSASVNENETAPSELYSAMFYNFPAAKNKWSARAQQVWSAICTSQQLKMSDLMVMPYSSKDHSHLPNLKTVRNEKSRANWSFGVYAGGLATTTNVLPHKPICEVVGQIFTREEYANDGLNQYAQLGGPKAGVVFVPGLPLVVDSRRRGSEALFIQRSAQPNAYLVTRKDQKGQLRVIVYARKSIKAGQEVTLGWHWGDSHPVTQYLEQLGQNQEPNAELDSAIKDIAWLLGITDPKDLNKYRSPPGTDEDWSALILDTMKPRAETATERIIRDFEKQDQTKIRRDEPETALQINVWTSAPQSVEPPPKKRMTLSDYIRKKS